MATEMKENMTVTEADIEQFGVQCKALVGCSKHFAYYNRVDLCGLRYGFDGSYGKPRYQTRIARND